MTDCLPSQPNPMSRLAETGCLDYKQSALRCTSYAGAGKLVVTVGKIWYSGIRRRPRKGSRGRNASRKAESVCAAGALFKKHVSFLCSWFWAMEQGSETGESGFAGN
jgi:hypothetical protein